MKVRFVEDDDDDRRVLRVKLDGAGGERSQSNNPVLDAITNAVQQEMLKKLFKDDKKDVEKKDHKDTFTLGEMTSILLLFALPIGWAMSELLNFFITRIHSNIQGIIH